MSDLAPVAPAGKERRVVGVFVLMMGAGIILDAQAHWLGTIVMLFGAASFASGLFAARPRSSASADVHMAATPSAEGSR